MAYGDLTTLAEVKAWLQTGATPFPATDDALLARLITAASRFIETWLNRPVAPADFSETRDGTGGQLLVFANAPVIAVLSVSIDGLAIPPAAAESGFGAGYSFTATELALRGYVFTRRPQNVRLRYTAGYVAPPADIAQACIELVCRRYRERSRIGEAARAVPGGETVRFAPSDIGGSVKTLLSPYRAVAPLAALARQPAPTDLDAALAGAVL